MTKAVPPPPPGGDHDTHEAEHRRGRREVIAGNLSIYVCDACDEAAEADWQGVVANIVEKMNRGDFD